MSIDFPIKNRPGIHGIEKEIEMIDWIIVGQIIPTYQAFSRTPLSFDYIGERHKGDDSKVNGQ